MPDVVLHEWPDVKDFLKSEKIKDPLVTDEQAWVLVMRHSCFPNFKLLLKILKSLPTSTSDCERGFSLMKRFKTELRSRLGTKFVSCMMSVKLNTESYGMDFDSTQFVESWCSKKNRRMNCSGERRPRTKKTNASEQSDNHYDLTLSDVEDFFGENEYFA